MMWIKPNSDKQCYSNPNPRQQKKPKFNQINKQTTPTTLHMEDDDDLGLQLSDDDMPFLTFKQQQASSTTPLSSRNNVITKTSKAQHNPPSSPSSSSPARHGAAASKSTAGSSTFDWGGFDQVRKERSSLELTAEPVVYYLSLSPPPPLFFSFSY